MNFGLQGDVLLMGLPVRLFDRYEYLSVGERNAGKRRRWRVGKGEYVCRPVLSAVFLVDQAYPAVVDEGDRDIFRLFSQALLCLICQTGVNVRVYRKLSLVILNFNGHSMPPANAPGNFFSVREGSLLDRVSGGGISTREFG